MLVPFISIVLMAGWPVLNIAAQNTAYVPVETAVLFVAGHASVAVLPALAISQFRVGPSAARALQCAGVAAVLFVSYAYWSRIDGLNWPLSEILGLSGRSLVASKLAILVLLIGTGIAVWNKIAPARGSSWVLLAVGLGLISVPATQLLFRERGQNWSNEALERAKAVGDYAGILANAEQRPAFVKKPHVFFIVLDGYAGPEALRAVFDFDNDGLMESLRQRDFLVLEQSYANYPMTQLSLSSTFNMTYMVQEGTYQKSYRGNFNAYLSGNNIVVERFNREGYVYVHAEPGYYQDTRCGNFVDVCLKPMSFLNEVEVALLKTTAAYDVIKALYPSFFDDLTKQFNDLDLFRENISRIPRIPSFVFVHILAPHPPYRFDGDCRERHNVEPELTGWDSDAKPFYIESLKCVNRRLLATIDEILTVFPGSIVIVQGDHGSAFLSGGTGIWDDADLAWDRGAIVERLNIMNAMLLPERCRRYAYDTITPVNTFRLVIGCLSGRAPQLLADQHYLASYTHGIVRAVDLSWAKAPAR